MLRLRIDAEGGYASGFDQRVENRVKTRYLLAWVPVLLASSGCSLFFELNANQCQVTKDCTNLGPQFADTLCVNQVCVAKSVTGNAGAGGGSGDNGGSGSGGKAGTGATSGGDSLDAGAAGEIGAGGSPECATNGDCISAHLDQPYLCVHGSCLALTSTDCPVMLPSSGTLDMLRKPAPIIVGGYANMNNPQDPHDSQAVINWDLAFSEFNDQTLGGIPNKAGGAPRPVLALVCQSGSPDITPTLQHLTEEVRVPAILSTLSPDKLFAAFNATQDPTYAGNPVLFLSTGSADLRLADLADDGLVWHMLGDPRTLAATTVALLDRIIPTVEAARTGKTDPLHVTLVYSDDSTMSDLFSVLTTADDKHPETLLTFNGKAAIDQLESGEFRELKIQSAKTHTTPDNQQAIDDLNNNPPDIVVAMATNEFPAIINAVENYAASKGRLPPFYLASHLLYNTPELKASATTNSLMNPPLDERLVGVNYAEAQDDKSKQLYDAYLARLKSSYQGALAVSGTENYYDGAYSVLYSLAAAFGAQSVVESQRTAPTGADVSKGLDLRVFSTSASRQSVDIGPAALGNTVSQMSNQTYNISLYGTMGPPNFDRTSGTRVSTTSAWCIAKPNMLYQADGLIYDPDGQAFTAPAAGVPSCLSKY